MKLGISHAIRDAYCFLSNNYNGRSNRDEIILVGFSRGAFTVRCLAQFISRVGLLARNALPFLPVFFGDWVRGDDESLNKRLDGAGGLFYNDPKIKVLAEWDPVDRLGIPYPRKWIATLHGSTNCAQTGRTRFSCSIFRRGKIELLANRMEGYRVGGNQGQSVCLFG